MAIAVPLLLAEERSMEYFDHHSNLEYRFELRGGNLVIYNKEPTEVKWYLCCNLPQAIAHIAQQFMAEA
jgi:hypothetical protein